MKKTIRTTKSIPLQRFQSERALVSAYLKSMPKEANSFRIVHTELESGNGIADVVRVRLRRDWRHAAALRKIRPQWAFALRHLPDRKRFTTDFFAEMTGTTRKTARTILSAFKTAKFCIEGFPANTWIKVKQPIPLASEIVAIEAKLDHWQRALPQAYRYLDYATEAWVLLDHANAAGAIKNIKAFKRLNVGLVTLSSGKRPKKLYVPKKQLPKSEIRYWGVLCSISKLSF
jgi:hypothetical protein